LLPLEQQSATAGACTCAGASSIAGAALQLLLLLASFTWSLASHQTPKSLQTGCMQHQTLDGVLKSTAVVICELAGCAAAAFDLF
jgi:hypothetical protein